MLFIGRSCQVDLSELAEREFRSVVLTYTFTLYGDTEIALSPMEMLVLRRNFMLIFMQIVEECDDYAENCEELLKCIEEGLDRNKILALTQQEVKVSDLVPHPEQRNKLARRSLQGLQLYQLVQKTGQSAHGEASGQIAD